MSDLGDVFGGQGFDANQHQSQAFDVLPAGEYEAIIVQSEVKPNSAQTGKMLKLQLQIISGQFQNRVLFDQLNIDNPSDKAKQIALGTLSDICKAVNVLTPKNSSELHDKPLRIKVVVKKSDEYGEQNNIKAYKPRNAGGSLVASTSAPAGAPYQYANSSGQPGQLQAAGAPSAPWAGKS